MKARLQPIVLPDQNEREKIEFEEQLARLTDLYKGEAIFLSPIEIGEAPDPKADAIAFVQLTGSIFRNHQQVTELDLPLITLTSPFGTIEMWDWEIVAYLREKTTQQVFAPYSERLAKVIMRALGAKKKLRSGLKFLVFQDSPGEGMQAGIFKKFYWWEREATRQMEEAFGLEIVYRSYKELNQNANRISDDRVRTLLQEEEIPHAGVTERQLLDATKLYCAVLDVIEEIGDVQGVGANCLNESFNSKTTPCLAWNLLFEKKGILWVCEGDTVSLISEFIVYTSLKRPLLMTNLYPFLMGMAALKHERIDTFPEVDDPVNYALAVHCGYFGLAPQSFCSRWVVRPKVLEIVNDHAIMVDCEMTPGQVVLAKLHPNMRKMVLIEASIEGYEHYPGSDCLNGALIHFSNRKGHEIMQGLSSHHSLIVQGDCTHELVLLAQVYGFEYEIF